MHWEWNLYGMKMAGQWIPKGEFRPEGAINKEGSSLCPHYN